MDIIEKDSITINRGTLYYGETENEYITRIPYTKEFIKYPKEVAQWITDITLKVHVEDTAIFEHSFDLDFLDSDMVTGKELKDYYDDVINYHLLQQQMQQQKEENQNYIKVIPEYKELAHQEAMHLENLDTNYINEPEPEHKEVTPEYKELVHQEAMHLEDLDTNYINEPELEHKEVTPEDKELAYQEAMRFGEFEHNIYKDENVMKFYPQQMRDDTEFQSLIAYRNQQNIFMKDYVQRNDTDKALECQERINATDALIADKSDSYVNKLHSDLKPEMDSLNSHSPVSLDVEAFKAYPADLQRDNDFKRAVIYRAQLEDYRNNFINIINTNTQELQQAINQGASPDVLLKFENTIKEHEGVYVQKIAQLTDKINSLDFSINYQVSKMQSVTPVEIPMIGEKMNKLGIMTADQIKQPIHNRENVLSIGKKVGNVGVYQTRDGQNFIGRTNNRGIQQIGKYGTLKDISKSFKNFAVSVKQEIKLQQKQQRIMSLPIGRER